MAEAKKPRKKSTRQLAALRNKELVSEHDKLIKENQIAIKRTKAKLANMTALKKEKIAEFKVKQKEIKSRLKRNIIMMKQSIKELKADKKRLLPQKISRSRLPKSTLGLIRSLPAEIPFSYENL